MAFKKITSNQVAQADPESLFRDLRSRKVQGLLSQQADMLRSYMTLSKESDLALELPTGSGKTLVGLLIAEWRRLRFQERCLLLCPTNQLVHQVVEQSKEKYGIDLVGFVGSHRTYDRVDLARFTSAQAVGVTNYSTLFNSRPALPECGTLIFDDAHAAENYVSKCWSVEILRHKTEHKPVFEAIVALISKFVSEQDRLSFEEADGSPLDSQWVNKLPTPALYEIHSELISALDVANEVPEIAHPWGLIRQNLFSCCLYYTATSILLRPIVPPTESFSPFRKANQRIYMSATLGEGGDLERIFGTYRIKRIPAPMGWEKQGIGRRFILLPMCTQTEEEAARNVVRWVTKFSRALVLTPSEKAAEEYRQLAEEFLAPHGYRTFSAAEIEKSKAGFTSAKGIAILANRYDGIDLIEDECRYLVVSGLPEATNLQERFLMSRMGAGAMFSVRIRTRIIQAIGRCTRSSIDWALVAIVGEKANSYFLRKENWKYLHPELQAEIEFGFAQSLTDYDEMEANIAHFVLQDGEWGEANQQLLQLRDEKAKVVEQSSIQLERAVRHEIEFANNMWRADFRAALACAADVLQFLDGDELRGYRAWWSYLAGSAAYLCAKHGEPHYENTAKDWFTRASTAAPSILWLRRLSSGDASGAPAEVLQTELIELVERIEKALEALGKSNSKKIEAKSLRIRKGLSQGSDAGAFESAQVELGALLGYVSLKSDDDSAPDPYWIMTNKTGLVFEDYTAPTGDHPRIGKSKILQAKGHTDWLAEKYPGVTFSVVLCAATDAVTRDSAPFRKGVYFLHAIDMARFADDALKFVRTLWDSYSTSDILAWREFATHELNRTGFSPDKVLERMTQRPLTSMPVASSSVPPPKKA